MSPEQASGEPAIDARSDQYSLAVVAYQMLSGRAPFEGETARAIIAKQLLDQPAALDTLIDNAPSHIVAALHRAMQKNPKDRFASIKDFAAALQDPGYRNPPSIPSVRPTATAGTGAGGWVPWAAGAVAVVLLGWVAMAELRPPRSIPPAPLSPRPEAPTDLADSTRDAAPPPPPPTRAPVPAPPASDSGRAQVVTTITPPQADSGTPPAPPVSCATLAEQGDWARALDRCVQEAQGGNSRAAKVAAVVLAEGRGTVAADEARAATFYQQAARAGDAESQFWIARRAEAREPSLATEMYLAAARNRFEPAYPALAVRFDRGLGTARDSAAAAHWYEEAARVGDVGSQVRIAELYARGIGVPRSDSASLAWYRRAADRGRSAEAQYQLALIHFRGRGVPKSEEEGLRWLRMAADAGHPEARKELARRKP
jgi:TPR repeat protein